MKIQIKQLTVILFVLLFLSFNVIAAGGVWIQGKVTGAPYKEDEKQYIEVNDKVYWILPDIRITYRFERRWGAFDEREATVSSISVGQDIMIKAIQNEINQIILY